MTYAEAVKRAAKAFNMKALYYRGLGGTTKADLEELTECREGDEEALSVLSRLAGENERLRPILDERKRQDKKWGVQNHGPMTWLAILTEEVGEAAKAVLEGNAEGYQKELTHVAAVAVAMGECFKRGEASLVSVTEIQAENAALKQERDDAQGRAGAGREAVAG